MAMYSLSQAYPPLKDLTCMIQIDKDRTLSRQVEQPLQHAQTSMHAQLTSLFTNLIP